MYVKYPLPVESITSSGGSVNSNISFDNSFATLFFASASVSLGLTSTPYNRAHAIHHILDLSLPKTHPGRFKLPSSQNGGTGRRRPAPRLLFQALQVG